VLCAGTAIAAFCVAARPEPSVLRAAAMGAVGLLALSIGRRAAAVPAVGVSVVLLIAADPWLSRSYGFALSVLATLGLVVLAPRLAARWSRVMPRWLALALAVPASAQLACSPVLVMLNPSVSLVAVPANLAVDAAVAPATLSGVAAALLWPVFPAGAKVFAWFGGLACDWIAAAARFAAGLPSATVPWPEGARGVVSMAVLVAVVVVLGARGPGPGRTAAYAVVVAAAVGGGGWLAAGHAPGPLRPGWPDGPWDLALCDVGQGLAVVVRLAPDHDLMIDTGPEPQAADGCLRRLGVTRLDTVLLTHDHADHVGGLAGVLRGRQVGEILVGPLDEPSSGFSAVTRAATERRVPVRRLLAGGHHDIGDGQWTALWPRPVDVPASRGDDEQVNDLSLVIDIHTSGGLHALVLGDVETWAQSRLLRDLGPALPRPDVVVVAHHGSADQVGELYLRLAAPVGLIGVGAGNDYGHPDPRTLAMLARAGTRVWRSDVDGDVLVDSRTESIDVVTR
jgi:competence protein ComEC